MSQALVEDILEQIAKLPEEDRLLLERRLADVLEGEWQREAAEARGEAQRRGVNQAAIDRAVQEIRRGRQLPV